MSGEGYTLDSLDTEKQFGHGQRWYSNSSQCWMLIE